MAFRRCVQDGLVDDVVVAVPASRGFEALDTQLGEQSSVEALDLIAAVERTTGAPGDVVLGVGGEPLDERPKVAGFLGPILEDSIGAGLAPDQLAAAKAWLVASAQRPEAITRSRRP